MRARLIRAIIAALVALSLFPMPSVAQATARVTELRTHCSTQRTPAMVEMFGENYTPEQANILDERLEQDLNASTLAQLAEAYQAFERNVMSRRPAADRYAQCIYGERLRQLDPRADLQTVLRGEYTPPATSPANSAWDAALTRRDSSAAAGSAVLAQSADPASRAARARENAALRQQAEQRIAQRRADNAAMWSAILQAATVGLQTYIQVEAAQAQPEANPDAQSWGPTPWSQQQQAAAPSQPSSNQTTAPCTPPGTVSYYGVRNCDSGDSDTASDGYVDWCRRNLSYYENERVTGRDSPFVRGTIQRCRQALGLPPLAM